MAGRNTAAGAPDHGPDATGYVQAVGKGDRASFVGNSGIKFGTVYATNADGLPAEKDVEVAILDVPAMSTFAGGDKMTYAKGQTPDDEPEWRLSIVDHITSKPFREGVTTLLNGVRYGGNIANLSPELISPENVQILATTNDSDTAKSVLDPLFCKSGAALRKKEGDPSPSGGKMSIDVTRQEDGWYTLAVTVNDVPTYREVGIFVTLDVPRFQSHWGSSMVTVGQCLERCPALAARGERIARSMALPQRSSG